MAESNNATAPRCLHEVLARMEAGCADKADADFMRELLRNASLTIERLQYRVTALIERLNAKLH